MARCHGLEHQRQTKSKRQSTRAPWIRRSKGPQRTADRRKEPKQEQPRRNEQADNRAHRSGTGGRGQPPWAGSSGNEASGPGMERPGLRKEEEVARTSRKANKKKNKSMEQVRDGGRGGKRRG